MSGGTRRSRTMIVPLLAVLIAACAGGTSSGGAGEPSPSAPPSATESRRPQPSSDAATPSGAPGASVPAPSATDAAVPTEAATPAASIGASPPASASATEGWRAIDAGEGPSAREDHTWTVDESGTAAYLFGGRAGADQFADLWRYDLTADVWEALRPVGSAPVARFGHTATWIPGSGLAIWSGQHEDVFLNDLWIYDPASGMWTEEPARGDLPGPRYGSCAVLDGDGRLVISHGFTFDGRFADTRAYDPDARSWSDITPAGETPVERCLHDCLWTPDGRLVLYAGQTTDAPALGDLWTLDASGVWTEAPPPEPAARQLYALAQLASTAYVFGGTGADGSKLDDLWTLDLESLAWEQVTRAERGPSARSGATLVADGERGRLLLFGGEMTDGAIADLWELRLGG